MPINFFKQPLNHDWTCLKAIIIHQHAIEPIPSSGSSITPKLRAGTKFCALISTCSFKLSSGPINPPPNLLIGTEFWALPPFFVNRFDDFFYPLISFLFATWGGKMRESFARFSRQVINYRAPHQWLRVSHSSSVGTRRCVILTTEETKQEMVVIGADRERKSTLWVERWTNCGKSGKNWNTNDFWI